MGGMFSMLEGLSPWWWVAFGIGLGALEMATLSFFLLWPGIAALVMAGLLVVAPGMPGTVQVTVFAAISVALTFGGRFWIRRFGDGGGPKTDLNAPGERMVGRVGTVLSTGTGTQRIEIDGTHWAARWSGPATVGAAMIVTGVEGMTLLCEPVAARAGDPIAHPGN